LLKTKCLNQINYNKPSYATLLDHKTHSLNFMTYIHILSIYLLRGKLHQLVFQLYSADALLHANPWTSRVCLLSVEYLVFYTVSRNTRGRQYFWHYFDKFKYIVVIICKKYQEHNAKLLTHQKSTSPNPCCYFTLRTKHWPRIAKRKVITDNCN